VGRGSPLSGGISNRDAPLDRQISDAGHAGPVFGTRGAGACRIVAKHALRTHADGGRVSPGCPRYSSAAACNALPRDGTTTRGECGSAKSPVDTVTPRSFIHIARLLLLRSQLLPQHGDVRVGAAREPFVFPSQPDRRIRRARHIDRPPLCSSSRRRLRSRASSQLILGKHLGSRAIVAAVSRTERAMTRPGLHFSSASGGIPGDQ